ncbi:carboxypeptidase-like regulatory domain-containing protein, partial [Acidobacteria bacterium AH-259-L09]|nr:carboxypeptidase-like regulatory domain-containing protein [Acidobacteria bacterium AH-259-L09]
MKTYRALLTTVRGLLALCLLAALAVSPALAQAGADTGLAGTVTDETGASLPGVDVTITKVDTGEERSAITNDLGDWEARFLAAGSYRVTFELPGFKTLNREGVTVTTLKVSTLNVTLPVGEIADTIEVRANVE